MNKSQRKTLSARLDDKSVEDILVNLPVKSLMRFKCVSKSWKAFIEEDSAFIQSHLSISKARPPQLLVMIHRSIFFHSPKDHCHGYFKGGLVFLHKVTIPWCRGAMLNPIHGLACIVDASNGVTRVCNLSTGQTTPWAQSSTPLRGSSLEISLDYGFGFDPLTNKYKILCVWELPGRRCFEYGGRRGVDQICEVFTVGENQWRKIDEVPPVRLVGPAVYANGSIYMRNSAFMNLFSFRPENKVIVAFDVGTEKFRIIQIPNYIVGSSSSGTLKECSDGPRPAKYLLLEIDGRIALVDRVDTHVVKLWISDDDTSNKEKKMTRTNWTEETISLPPSFEQGYIALHPVQGTDEIIINQHSANYNRSRPRTSIHLYIYNRTMKSFQMIDVTAGISPCLTYPSIVFSMYMYHESLVPVLRKPAVEEMPDQPSSSTTISKSSRKSRTCSSKASCRTKVARST